MLLTAPIGTLARSRAIARALRWIPGGVCAAVAAAPANPAATAAECRKVRLVSGMHSAFLSIGVFCLASSRPNPALLSGL